MNLTFSIMYPSTSEPTLWEQMLLLFVVFIVIAPQCDRLSTGKKIQQRLLLLLLLFHVVLIITANKMICYVNSISHSRLNTFSISFFFLTNMSVSHDVLLNFDLHYTLPDTLVYYTSCLVYNDSEIIPTLRIFFST